MVTDGLEKCSLCLGRHARGRPHRGSASDRPAPAEEACNALAGNPRLVRGGGPGEGVGPPRPLPGGAGSLCGAARRPAMLRSAFRLYYRASLGLFRIYVFRPGVTMWHWWRGVLCWQAEKTLAGKPPAAPGAWFSVCIGHRLIGSCWPHHRASGKHATCSFKPVNESGSRVRRVFAQTAAWQ